MLLMVATKKGQGKRKNDFTWTEEGEIVTFSNECDGEKIDGPCGCRRSMTGLNSRKATTTMLVKEMDMTPDQLKEKLRESFKKAGFGSAMEDERMKRFIETDAKELMRIANCFQEGDVIERRGDKFNLRYGG